MNSKAAIICRFFNSCITKINSGVKLVSETAVWLGETYGFWAQTGIFFLTALIGCGTLIYNVRQIKHLSEQLAHSREQARNNENLVKMRATIDVVLNANTNPDFQKCRKEFGKLRDANVTFAQYACGNLTEHEDKNDIILPVLNNYEFMAAGIRSGAFDEGIYKKMQKSTVIRDWGELSGYVMQIRSNSKNGALYVEFESIAKQWEREPPNRAD